MSEIGVGSLIVAPGRLVTGDLVPRQDCSTVTTPRLRRKR
jgi:hypothetical protein